jgi:hypothetical protein
MCARSELRDQVEHIVHTSEILAVARALQAGAGPRVGQSIDTTLNPVAAGLVTRWSKRRTYPFRAAKPSLREWRLIPE